MGISEAMVSIVELVGRNSNRVAGGGYSTAFSGGMYDCDLVGVARSRSEELVGYTGEGQCVVSLFFHNSYLRGHGFPIQSRD